MSHVDNCKDVLKFRKMIYFPSVYETTPEGYGIPWLVWVCFELEDSFGGVRDERDIGKGVFGFFAKKRCLEFSEEGWELVLDYIARRQALNEEYRKSLFSKVRKYGRKRKQCK